MSESEKGKARDSAGAVAVAVLAMSQNPTPYPSGGIPVCCRSLVALGMSISLSQTFAIHILLMKVRKKNPPLDLKTHATALMLTDKTEGALTTGLVYHMEEAIARSRKLLQETETVCQERRAARKRQAELPASTLRKRAS